MGSEGVKYYMDADRIAQVKDVMRERNLKLYKVSADYRKDRIHHPMYYVFGGSAKFAKARFQQRVTWLMVYAVQECTAAEVEEVLNHWDKYIVF